MPQGVFWPINYDILACKTYEASDSLKENSWVVGEIKNDFSYLRRLLLEQFFVWGITIEIEIDSDC